jgi:hypothetical protein
MSPSRWGRAAVHTAAELLRSLTKGLRREPNIYKVRSVKETPDRLQSFVLYLVVEDSLPLHASMASPRGKCADILNMNLLRSSRLDLESRPTASRLRPSVWRKPGCGCHFWMREGRVDWC